MNRRWQIIEDRAEMERFGPEWDAIASGLGLSAFAGSGFALAYRDAFAPERGRVAVHVLRLEDQPVAILPLERRGRVIRVWTSFDNEHAPACDLVIAELPGVGTAIVEHLLETADGLVLRRVAPESAAYRTLCGAAALLGLPVGLATEAVGDTYLRLASDLEARMPAKLRQNVRAKLARLERAGRVEFRRIGGGAELGPALADCFEVEASGWKGAAGSPIKARPETDRFYRDLAHRTSGAGQFALYILTVEGNVIGFRYCLRGGGRLDSLKTGYHPAWATYAPGVLTKLLMARQELAQGEIHTLHFGPPSEDKLRWATGILPLATLRIYGRTWRARLAYVAPAMVRGAVARWPAAHAASDWARRALGRLREEGHRRRVRIGKRLSSRLPKNDPRDARVRERAGPPSAASEAADAPSAKD